MEKSDECIIVYIDLDNDTKSLVQEATGRFEKIETISLADFSNLNLSELNNGGLLIFPVNSMKDVGRYCYELQELKKSTDLFRKILLVK
ncbi:MAG: hypothetical protein P8J82_10505, partial [Tateyamaria sp.]|nr:hypothetical protein [Tateyamaria sp.]